MIYIILSPSKTINQSVGRNYDEYDLPYYLKESSEISRKLSKCKVKELGELLDTSNKLSELAYDRYQFWNIDHSLVNAKQAILSFKGDVYSGLDADSFSDEDLSYSNDHLIIFSGLYGILQSLDLIQPYRLEIAAKLKIGRKKDLYDFWKDKITSRLNQLMESDDNPILINLASNEYFKSIDTKRIKCPIITQVFKENKNGNYKVVSIFAKRARGLLTSYIIRNRIDDPEKIKLFDEEGYYYNDNLSSRSEIVFTRG